MASKKRWTLRGGIVLSSGRKVKIDVLLVYPPDLTAEESKELRSAHVALHDLTPVEEVSVQE